MRSIVLSQKSFFTFTELFAYHLITAIRTVNVSITAPPGRNAMPISAWKVRVRLTSWGCTFYFISPISAIVIAIAHPSLLDALSISTSEFVGATRFICLHQNHMTNILWTYFRKINYYRLDLICFKKSPSKSCCLFVEHYNKDQRS